MYDKILLHEPDPYQSMLTNVHFPPSSIGAAFTKMKGNMQGAEIKLLDGWGTVADGRSSYLVFTT